MSLRYHTLFALFVLYCMHSSQGLVAGGAGWSLNFDGIADGAAVRNLTGYPDEVTVMFWTKASEQQISHNLISFYGNEPFSEEFVLYSELMIDMIRGGTNGDGFYTYFDFVQVNDPRRWFHVAASWEKSGLTVLHVNGEFVRVRNTTTAPFPFTGDLYLALEADSHDGLFDVRQTYGGTFDELRMYDRVLSAEEIRYVMHGASLPEEALALYYSFDVDGYNGNVVSQEGYVKGNDMLLIGKDLSDNIPTHNSAYRETLLLLWSDLSTAYGPTWAPSSAPIVQDAPVVASVEPTVLSAVRLTADASGAEMHFYIITYPEHSQLYTSSVALPAYLLSPEDLPYYAGASNHSVSVWCLLPDLGDSPDPASSVYDHTPLSNHEAVVDGFVYAAEVKSLSGQVVESDNATVLIYRNHPPIVHPRDYFTDEDTDILITLPIYDQDGDYVRAVVTAIPDRGYLVTVDGGIFLDYGMGIFQELTMANVMREYPTAEADNARIYDGRMDFYYAVNITQEMLPYTIESEGHEIIFVPEHEDSGVPYTQFSYYGIDPHGARSAEHTSRVDVYPIDDNPVPSPVNVTIDEDTPVLIRFDFTDIDSDFMSVRFVIDVPPVSGGKLYASENFEASTGSNAIVGPYKPSTFLQYASEIFDSNDILAGQMLGEPECYPLYGSCDYAAFFGVEGGQYAEVAFPSFMFVSKFITYEVFDPTCLVKVEVYDERSMGYTTVYEAEPELYGDQRAYAQEAKFCQMKNPSRRARFWFQSTATYCYVDGIAASGTASISSHVLPQFSVYFVPEQDFNGEASFTFFAEDCTSASAITTATINILPVNDPPVFSNVTYFYTPGDANTTITILASDVDDSTASLTLLSVNDRTVTVTDPNGVVIRSYPYQVPVDPGSIPDGYVAAATFIIAGLPEEDCPNEDITLSMKAEDLESSTLQQIVLQCIPPYSVFEVFLGVILGTADADGLPLEDGLEALSFVVMAIDEINNKTDGIADDLLVRTTIQYAFQNSQGDENVAYQAASYLALDAFSGRGVDAILGPGPSADVLATQRLLAPMDVVQISHAADSYELSDQEHEYFFRTMPTETMQALALVDVAHALGITRVSVVYSASEYGSALREALLSYNTQTGYLMIVSWYSIYNENDFGSVLSSIEDSVCLVNLILCESNTLSAFLNAASGRNMVSRNGYTWFAPNTYATAKDSLVFDDIGNFYLSVCPPQTTCSEIDSGNLGNGETPATGPEPSEGNADSQCASTAQSRWAALSPACPYISPSVAASYNSSDPQSQGLCWCETFNCTCATETDSEGNLLWVYESEIIVDAGESALTPPTDATDTPATNDDVGEPDTAGPTGATTMQRVCYYPISDLDPTFAASDTSELSAKYPTSDLAFYAYDAVYVLAKALDGLIYERLEPEVTETTLRYALYDFGAFGGSTGPIEMESDPSGDRKEGCYTLLNTLGGGGGGGGDGGSVAVLGTWSSWGVLEMSANATYSTNDGSRPNDWCPDDMFYDTDLVCHQCPEGLHSYEDEMTKCTQCGYDTCPQDACVPGEYYNATVDSCVLCPLGSFSAEPAALHCHLCEIGEYGPDPGLTTCVLCGLDRYADAPGQARCHDCPANSEIVYEGGWNITQCRCKEQYWLDDVKLLDGGCRECPEGGVCEGGEAGLDAAQPYPESGYWGDVSFREKFWACPVAEVCGGKHIRFDCADGHAGRLCAKCKTDYFSVAAHCHECPSGSVSRILLTVAGIGLVVALWYFINSYAAGSYDSVDLLLLFYQMLAITGSFSFQWEGTLKNLFGLLSVVNFDVDFFTPDCIGIEWRSFYSVCLQLSLPLVYALYVGLSLRIRAWWFGKTLSTSLWHDHEFLKSVLCFIDITYHTLTIKTLSVFVCEAVGDHYEFMFYGPDVQCWTTDHYVLIIIASVALLVYVLGVPTLYCALLFHGSRRNKLANPWFLRSFGFLYKRFEAEYLWWHLMLTGRRLVFCIAYVGCFALPHIQAGLSILSASVALTAHSFARPFKSTWLDRMDAFFLSSLLVVIFGGFSLFSSNNRDESVSSHVLIFALAASCLIGLFFCLVDVYGTFRLRSRALQAARLAKTQDKLGGVASGKKARTPRDFVRAVQSEVYERPPMLKWLRGPHPPTPDNLRLVTTVTEMLDRVCDEAGDRSSYLKGDNHLETCRKLAMNNVILDMLLHSSERRRKEFLGFLEREGNTGEHDLASVIAEYARPAVLSWVLTAPPEDVQALKSMLLLVRGDREQAGFTPGGGGRNKDSRGREADVEAGNGRVGSGLQGDQNWPSWVAVKAAAVSARKMNSPLNGSRFEVHVDDGLERRNGSTLAVPQHRRDGSPMSFPATMATPPPRHIVHDPQATSPHRSASLRPLRSAGAWVVSPETVSPSVQKLKVPRPMSSKKLQKGVALNDDGCECLEAADCVISASDIKNGYSGHAPRRKRDTKIDSQGFPLLALSTNPLSASGTRSLPTLSSHHTPPSAPNGSAPTRDPRLLLRPPHRKGVPNSQGLSDDVPPTGRFLEDPSMPVPFRPHASTSDRRLTSRTFEPAGRPKYG